MGRRSSQDRPSATPAPACCWRSAFSALSTAARRQARASTWNWQCRTPCCNTSASPLPPQAPPGRPAGRAGSKLLSGKVAPSGVYPCKPGGPNDYVYIYTSRANPEHWTRLLKAISRDDLVGDSRYETNQARSQRAAEVDEIIAQWTRQHSKEEAMKIIGGAGVPAGAVFDTLELMNDPSLAERGIMQTIEHPTTGKVKMPAWPVRFDGTPPKVKPSPLLGQHNADVLSGWLGIAASEVEALRAEGIT